MSRKSYRESHKDYLQRDYDRWRLLARNPDFRKDLCAYLKGCGTGLFRSLRKRPLLSRRQINRFQRLSQQYLYKWGIIWPPDAALWPESDFTITPERLDRWYLRQREEDSAFSTCLLPVFMSRIRKGTYPSRLFVEFDIDTSLPIDLILGLMDKQLRSWYWKEFGPHDRGKPPSIDLQLKVFDLLQEGQQSFAAVARLLNKKATSVRDAYYAALTKIGIERAPSPRSVPLPRPIEECAQCQKAKSVPEMCRAHQMFVTQDEGSQKDRLLRFWTGA